MSSIAEHLAAIEFYRLLGMHEQAHTESWMLTNVHWKDLVSDVPVPIMEAARVDMERRLREQHPTTADGYIDKWRAARASSAAQGEAR